MRSLYVVTAVVALMDLWSTFHHIHSTRGLDRDATVTHVLHGNIVDDVIGSCLYHAKNGFEEI